MDTDLTFVEKAPHEKGFAKHFAQHIKPKLLELENERLRALQQFRRRVPFAIFAGAAVLYGAGNMLYIVESPTFELVAFIVGVSFVLLLLLFVWARSLTLDYTIDSKDKIIQTVLRFLGHFDYDPRGVISDSRLTISCLFEEFDSAKGANYIKGNWKGVPFQFSEVVLRKRKGFGSGSTTITVFEGFVFVLDLLDETHQYTIAITNRTKVIDMMGWKRQDFQNVEEIHFVDSKMQGKFSIFSTSPEHAHRVITPNLIEIIQKVTHFHHATGVEFYVGSKMFLLSMSTNRKLFKSLRADESALTSDDARRFLAEANEVLQVIDGLVNVRTSQNGAYG